MEAVEDLLTGERLTGKGDVTRYRTVITDDPDGAQRMVDESVCLTGRVLSAVGANSCRVRTGHGQVFHCSVRRVLRTMLRDSRNAVVAGDRVMITPVGESEGVVEKVEPRTSALNRESRGRAHAIVANVDQAVIVCSVQMPDLKPGLIDRFLCSTEKGGIRAIICINKIDLGDPAELQPLVGSYAQLGYPVLATNALSGEGISQLRELLANQESVFTGQSGVGKSSLMNAVQPGLGLRIGHVSAETSKGRHTTRVAELIELDFGGWIVDTPGIRQFSLWDAVPEELEGTFIEFRPFVAGCRYPNCSHIHETGCAVQDAVGTGLISPVRYHNYVRIFTGDAT